MADGGGRVVDPMDAFGSGVATSPAVQSAMAQLMPADLARGFSTPYYAARTNDGDLAGAVMVGDGQRVRLVDPSTGQVLVERSGPNGAQEIVSLANAVSQDLGRKAAWQIQGETGPDTFTTMAAERYDPKKTGLLSQIIRIAAPVLGAMIPGLAPILGAALAGAGATAATGGSLKQSLLAGATAGVGSGLGSGLTSALGGSSFGSGLSTALRANPGSLSNILSGASLSGGGGVSRLLGSAGADTLGGAFTEIAPLTVTRAAGGGIGSALGGGVGGAASGLISGGAGSPFLQSGSGADRLTNPTSGETTVDEVVVTGGPADRIAPPISPTSLMGSFDPDNLRLTASSGLNNSSFARDNGAPTVDRGSLFDPAQIAGQFAGDLGANVLTGQLANWLGLLPKPDLAGVPDSGYEGSPDLPAVGDASGVGSTPPGPGFAGSTLAPSGMAGSVPASGIGGGGGGEGGEAGGGGGVLFNAGDTGAPSPGTAGTDVDVEGGFAPDIYPWRQARMAA